jgi:hypothetical protein
LNDFVEFTAGDIQKTIKTAMLFTLREALARLWRVAKGSA